MVTPFSFVKTSSGASSKLKPRAETEPYDGWLRSFRSWSRILSVLMRRRMRALAIQKITRTEDSERLSAERRPLPGRQRISDAR